MTYASLTGRAAIITGAARWIGRAIASRLSDEGCRVCIVDRDASAGSALAAALSDSGREALFVEADVASEQSCVEAVRSAENVLGPVHILVNNASLLSTTNARSFWDLETEEWDETMAVNLRGMFLMMKAVAPSMTGRGAGSIVNMSSGVVYAGRSELAHYVASKAGVIGLTRTTARELGKHGIRVNAIAPSYVETGRIELTPERRASITAEMCLDDVPKPEDIADMAAFLASDQSAFVTGQVMSVDGGLSHH
jgi:3-oxoacyl-[acyl-carrier protein] reductase